MRAVRGARLPRIVADDQIPGPVSRRQRASGIGRFVARNRATAAGVLLLGAMVGTAVFAPAIAPYNPAAIDPSVRLEPSSLTHLLGTDSLGRDVLSRLIFGSRVSLVVGVVAAGLASTWGTAFGICAGYFRKIDMPVMRIMDGFMAFPGLLLALALITVQGPQLSSVVLVLGIVETPGMSRLMRSAVLSLRENQYVEAARASGAGDWRILLRHILPNATAPLLVQATFLCASAILAEAALSFLGTGVPTTTPTWGNIMGEGRVRFQIAPWLTIFPGIFISMTVLSISLIGDALRDLLDPTIRQASSP
jgi:peptide/nickel transport system permease protein